MVSIPAGSQGSELIAVSTQVGGCLQVTCWAPEANRTRWTCALGTGFEPYSPALCAVPDVDGDGSMDWVLVHQDGVHSQSAEHSTLTLGSGRSGRVLRQRRLGLAAAPYSITAVATDSSGFDVLIGMPQQDCGKGGLVWVRSRDLAAVVYDHVPSDQNGFGQFVGARRDGKPGAWVSAPWSNGPRALWSVEGPWKPPTRVIAEAAPDGYWRQYPGIWIAEPDAASIDAIDRIAVGVLLPLATDGNGNVRASQGAVRVGRLDAWPTARTIQGPSAMFGTQFGKVVTFADDLDDDGQPEILVTDPGFREESGPLGACYVIDSRTDTVRQLCQGDVSYARLGTAMVMIGDVDEDGFRDVALLAIGLASVQNAYMTVWSIAGRRELRRLPL